MDEPITSEHVQDNSKLTKAERKQERRAQKQRERERQLSAAKRGRFYRWAAFVIGVALIVAGLGLFSSRDREEPTSADDQGSLSNEVSAADWVKGNAEARATLVEYGDFQCPACAQFYPVIKALSDELGGDLRVVFRHFPLEGIHSNAQPAALAAEAAGRQGRFWEMHDVLFERQSEWSAGDASEKFEAYALELGLDINQFRSDLELDELNQKIAEHQRSGIRARVDSTPTFFLNGEKLVGFSNHDELRNKIVEVARGNAL